MGFWLSKMFTPTSPLEENHRVVRIKEKISSSVDYERHEYHSFNSNWEQGSSLGRNGKEINTLLEWCRSMYKEKSQNCSLLERHFIDVAHSDCSDGNGLHLRVMQWNILADALASGKDNFIKCPRDAISWETRKLHILEEILTYLPDVLCCQEVDHFDDFLHPTLSKIGYKGAFLPKPWSPCLDVVPNNGPDGCTIFYRASKFELIEYKAITLKTRTFWTNHVALFHLLQFKDYKKNCVKDERNTKHSDTKGRFLIGSTHLKAKAGYEQLREKQGRDLLTYLKKYADESVPIIMCGDFNATSDEAIYKLVCESDNPVLYSAYSSLGEEFTTGGKVRRCEPPYTTWCIRPHGETPKTVDYVWYTKDDFKVDRLLEIPTSEDITENRLPSFLYPSDHVSLVCDMTLCTEPVHTDNSIRPRI